MAMKHPDQYQPHNTALEKFRKIFNAEAKKKGIPLYMPASEENYVDDGKIIHTLTQQEIIFDFEKRHCHYITYGFPFDDLGQFGRKTTKLKISLSIQCNKNEDSFVVAWQEDFRKGKNKKVGCKTGSGDTEQVDRWSTTKFKEFRYSEMDKFQEMLLRAFKNNTFNASCFKIDNKDEVETSSKIEFAW